MQLYYTVLKTSFCPSSYGIFECKTENGKEVCKLVACTRPGFLSSIYEAQEY
ncbi:hypothetical protein [Acidianus manzaensis]|uniref:hypothetical protein n=1 Tax=Acidianus manzaensis TaxID=282676 RepID=UPI00164F9074|nr:hypothetical protein [Acidianus manzaensis]